MTTQKDGDATVRKGEKEAEGGKGGKEDGSDRRTAKKRRSENEHTSTDETNRSHEDRRTTRAKRGVEDAPIRVKIKRGRPSLSKSKPVESDGKEKITRGRPSLSKPKPVDSDKMDKISRSAPRKEVDGTDSLAPIEVKIKRGRPSSSKIKSVLAGGDESSSQSEGARKRGRPVVIRPGAGDELAPKSSTRDKSRKHSKITSQQSAERLSGAENSVIETETATSKLTRGRPKSGTSSKTVPQAKAPRIALAAKRGSKAEGSRKASGSGPITSKGKSSRKADDGASILTKTPGKPQGRKRRDVEAGMSVGHFVRHKN